MSYQAMRRHGGTLKLISQSKRSKSEKVTYYVILSIWHSGKDKAIQTEKISGCRVEGEEEVNGQNSEIFRAMKILCDFIMMDKCHFYFFQTHRMYNTKRKF